MLKQAAALRQHDLRADFARTGTRTAVAAIGQALQAQGREEPAWAEARLVAGADGMLTLHRGAPPAAAAAQPAEAETVRLEIRNGNGVTGMARALSRKMVAPGLMVTRLSNEQGFGVRHTRIEYEAAYLDAARKLAQHVGSAQLREVPECAPADLRLVLGRDMAGRRQAFVRQDALRTVSIGVPVDTL
ncbi:LytR C-terminal domain-containing protein [Massilia niastensis]|uniref:LytR C-terminal domain-containing protein n=1 Tax=Massilia niastensis TaxID=544911 RepID=UPI0003679AA8|nr:LytR C-terminal domain-containing protein [Massilia niastensis]